MAAVDLTRIPQYKSHKVVRAAKIIGINRTECFIKVSVPVPGGDDFLEVPVPENFFARSVPKIDDYLVVYDDNYIAHSPKQQFLDGYTKITR